MSQTVKNSPAMQETWVGKIPWRREQLPTSVFRPGEFHGYSPWSRNQLDMTERLSLHFCKWSTEGNPKNRIKQVSKRGKDNWRTHSTASYNFSLRPRRADGTSPTETEGKGGRGRSLFAWIQYATAYCSLSFPAGRCFLRVSQNRNS